ncbi:FkbM family methyltransferase [Pelagibacterales bacterium SAG-MED13]|nr:FkbM family methyltransferase [Pelagibacterales bacterium SAG-MED13]
MSVKKFIKSITPKYLLELYYDFKNRRKTYFGHHELDRKLEKYLNYKNGFFVELGANDGIKQSNTYYFEKNFNWKGILVEPIKDKYIKCKKFRSNKNYFYNNACISFSFKKEKIKMIYSDLMSSISDKTILNKVDAKKHALEGEKYLLKTEKIEEVWVDTITLNEIFIEIKSPKKMDFLSLDVEGSELEVLNGIDFSTYNFKFILVESRNDDEIKKFLKIKDYIFLEKISKRDLFFKYKY